jgi:hypothetical protein
LPRRLIQMTERAFAKALQPSILRRRSVHAVSSWKHKSMLSLIMKGKAQERAANLNALEKRALTFQGQLGN